MTEEDLQKLLLSEFSFPSKERKSSSATYLKKKEHSGLSVISSCHHNKRDETENFSHFSQVTEQHAHGLILLKESLPNEQN